jgi:hypothetical protein
MHCLSGDGGLRAAERGRMGALEARRPQSRTPHPARAAPAPHLRRDRAAGHASGLIFE